MPVYKTPRQVGRRVLKFDPPTRSPARSSRRGDDLDSSPTTNTLKFRRMSAAAGAKQKRKSANTLLPAVPPSLPPVLAPDAKKGTVQAVLPSTTTMIRPPPSPTENRPIVEKKKARVLSRQVLIELL